MSKEAPTSDEIRAEVRPITLRFVKQISLLANNKYLNGAQVTGAIACAIMERVVINLATILHKDDKATGAKFIETVYDAAKKDALLEWERTGPGV